MNYEMYLGPHVWMEGDTLVKMALSQNSLIFKRNCFEKQTTTQVCNQMF